MPEHPLMAADRVVSAIAEAQIQVDPVRDPRLQALGTAIYGFIRAAGDEIADGDLWRPVLSKLKRYFFNLRATPLPPNHPGIRPESMLDLLGEAVELTRKGYPDLEEGARSLEATVTECVSVSDSELLLAILQRLEVRGGTVALLLAEPRHVDPVQHFLDALTGEAGRLQVLTARDLADTIYEEMLVLGRPAWFPDYVFTVPRTRTLRVITLAGGRDRVPEASPFPVQFGVSGPRPTVVEVGGGNAGEDGTESMSPEMLDELNPVVDWDAILKAGIAEPGTPGETGTSADVKARLYLLEGQHAVFLSDDPDSTVLVIKTGAGPGDDIEVSRVRIRELSRGDFLLLRTHGGGDMIVDVANVLLKEYRAEVRDKQRRWKRRLLDRVREYGLDAVAGMLRDRGAIRANETNLRNWMSERLIRPAAREDFNAIMALIGLQDRSDSYWKAMRMIEKAHHRAGRYIRKQLLERVRDVDAEALRREGLVRFQLEEGRGGDLTAFRIVEVAPATTLVPSHHLNTPFSFEE